jgi:hypothetical protein
MTIYICSPRESVQTKIAVCHIEQAFFKSEIARMLSDARYLYFKAHQLPVSTVFPGLRHGVASQSGIRSWVVAFPSESKPLHLRNEAKWNVLLID